MFPSSPFSQRIRTESHISSAPFRQMHCPTRMESALVFTCNCPSSLALHRTSNVRSMYLPLFPRTTTAAHIVPKIRLERFSPLPRYLQLILTLVNRPQIKLTLNERAAVQCDATPFPRTIAGGG